MTHLLMKGPSHWVRTRPMTQLKENPHLQGELLPFRGEKRSHFRCMLALRIPHEVKV